MMITAMHIVLDTVSDQNQLAPSAAKFQLAFVH